EKLRLDLIRLLRQQQQIISQPGPELPQQLKSISEEFLKLRQTFLGWVKTDGPIYGFTVREKPKEEPKN
ncbi:MAG: hypothetical protein AAB401_19965, partial [Acidobacteriota bacterium]